MPRRLSPSIVHSHKLLLLIMLIPIVGLRFRPLVGSAFTDLSIIFAQQKLFGGRDQDLAEAMRWYQFAQPWSSSTRQAMPVLIATLRATDACYLAHANGTLPQSSWGDQQVELLLQGRCLWMARSYDEAVQVWKKAPSVPLLFHLANYDQAAGRVDQALAEYSAVLAVDPALVEGWLRLASLYEGIANWKLAEDSYENAIAVAPESALAHARKAFFWWSRGLKDSRTEQELTKAIELASVAYPSGHEIAAPGAPYRLLIQLHAPRLDLPWLYTDLAGLYIWTGRPAQAEAAARNAIALEPNIFYSYIFLGEALRLQANGAGAVVAYEQALAKGGDQSDTYYGLARAYMQTGDLLNARKQAQHLVRAWPGESGFSLLLDEIDSRLGQ